MSESSTPFFPRMRVTAIMVPYVLVALFAAGAAINTSVEACLMLALSCAASVLAFGTRAAARHAALHPNDDTEPMLCAQHCLSESHQRAAARLLGSVFMDDAAAAAQRWAMLMFRFYLYVGVFAGVLGFVSGLSTETSAGLVVGVACAANAWLLAMTGMMGDFNGPRVFELLSAAEVDELKEIAGSAGGTVGANLPVQVWIGHNRDRLQEIRLFQLELAQAVQRAGEFARNDSAQGNRARAEALARLGDAAGTCMAASTAARQEGER